MKDTPEVARTIRSVDDLLSLLDGLFDRDADRWSAESGSAWWDAFYVGRSKPIPFFVDKPDENLVALLDHREVAPGRALDLGSGPGRNALFLAERGFSVEAIDLSPEAVAWGRERAQARGLDVRFTCGDAFTLPADTLAGPYDLIYDSGCLHHLAPHRRIGYLALLERALAPGGLFGLVCFARGQMGSELPDAQLYRAGRFEAGMSFSDVDLRWIFADLEEVELRAMVAQDELSPMFGQPFLATGLFRRPSSSSRAH
ncbi:class I SAM-dependent methyltransferase [Demequina sp. TTPB684]|uniref:class I SAM-dependent methyltransferase n=1 Tax=unclassified Demequina TaxID=2620311 RepID=UPI001CF4DCFE|nr:MULTISPECIES: class I SAM-dependent methyltransferase [unclassified Demequina]MCB2413958.1 class I SAM-dependent methyltransferase [Demequina sp. TTPB684]UPU88689.1 class I SAM-dependent methyltransferase [Demequina sp. TMPB413]